MAIEYLDGLVRAAIKAGQEWEGSGDTEELEYLANLASGPQIRKIAEIGFNAGMSSYTFLEANPEAVVYSFDLGEYSYVQAAKEHIDQAFPGRHMLIIGDSKTTVPEFQKNHPGLVFDLIFVDGGHTYELAKADLLNMRSFATEDTVLVTDDLTPWKPWGEGPTKAWSEMVSRGLVRQLELYRDGHKVTSIEPPGDRSWVMGKYRMSR
jgi:predicted O-methyltransferase YrrM